MSKMGKAIKFFAIVVAAIIFAWLLFRTCSNSDDDKININKMVQNLAQKETYKSELSVKPSDEKFQEVKYKIYQKAEKREIAKKIPQAMEISEVGKIITITPEKRVFAETINVIISKEGEVFVKKNEAKKVEVTVFPRKEDFIKFELNTAIGINNNYKSERMIGGIVSFSFVRVWKFYPALAVTFNEKTRFMIGVEKRMAYIYDSIGGEAKADLRGGVYFDRTHQVIAIAVGLRWK